MRYFLFYIPLSFLFVLFVTISLAQILARYPKLPNMLYSDANFIDGIAYAPT